MRTTLALLPALSFLLLVPACNDDKNSRDAAVADATAAADASPDPPDDPAAQTALRLVQEGREVFRHDTFGDEAFWSGTLRLHEAVATISPKTALSLGLRVDVEALPAAVVAALQAGQVDLEAPASTLVLLKADAVIGVKAGFDPAGTLASIGITCALCHSTVDDSLAPGVGKRRDGWPNRDLDVGAIIASAPDLSAVAELLQVDEATVRAVLAGWGPGKFDAALFLDGRATRPDGKTAATLLPPAYGLAGVSQHTFTGWGSVPYWNAFVATLEMHGQANFYDPRLDDAERFPVAARAGFGDVRVAPGEDRVAGKLAALHVYQLVLEPPVPPAPADAAAVTRGEALFAGAARCAGCHVPPLYTESGWNMHTAAEIGIDDFQAQRSPDGRYRTTPLRGLWARQKGGFYHDGRFATLADVVTHYDAHFQLGLSAAQQADLVAFLLSI